MTQEKKSTLFGEKNFRLLFTGETISSLGDQFTLIALPWLVVKLTNDPLILGSILALAGIPRALFMLIGGVLTDRFSPRAVMIVSNFIRLVNVGILSWLILAGAVRLWMIYIYSLVFGTADAFFIPAQSSMVTRISPRNMLEKANTLIMGSAQLCQFIGPLLVGLVISYFDQGSQNLHGIGLAMAFDTLTFVVSLTALLNINKGGEAVIEKKESIMKAIKEGLSYAWNNKGLDNIMHYYR